MSFYISCINVLYSRILENIQIFLTCVNSDIYHTCSSILSCLSSSASTASKNSSSLIRLFGPSCEQTITNLFLCFIYQLRAA